MYLSKIVLDGFKSFYTKTTVELDRGMTDIVGPNGCGKSNILDAVRWVLGEQSPNRLRSQEISDVISNGNKRRAAKKTASAFLTFSDCEEVIGQEDVEVGRSVDRDGQGTYYLDGEKVRLKDVRDLFRDTGIGQDLYSIIGQGEIQELIGSKPEERRELLEEAAGVATYRHRRQLTERRLKKTREDLDKVKEKINEDTGRLNQLEGQAKKANRVKEIQGELRQFRLELIRRKLERYNEKLDRIDGELKETENKGEEAKQKLEEVEENHRKLRRELSGLEACSSRIEQSLTEARKVESRAEEQLARKETLVRQLEEQAGEDRRRRSDYSRRLSENLEDLSELAREIYQARMRVQICRQRVEHVSGLEREVSERKQEVDRELEELRNSSLFQLSEENEHKHWLKGLREERRELFSRREKIDGEIRTLQSELNQDLLEHREGFESYCENETQRVKFRLDRSRISEQLSAVENLDSKVENRMSKLQREREKLRSRFQTLNNLQSNYEGYYEGVKKVMNSYKGQARDEIYGVVANLIDVESRYSDAVRGVLGGLSQAVVVENMRTARELMKFLNQNELGRVDFLVCNWFERNEPRVISNASAPGVVGRAVDLVTVESDYENLFKHLLGNALVVENLGRAFELRDELEPAEAVDVITVNGEFVGSDGEIRGGSPGRGSEDLVGRSARLKKLREREEDKSSLIDRLEATAAVLNDFRDRLTSRRDRIEGALRGVRDESRGAYEKIRESRHRLESAAENYRNLMVRMTETEAELLENSHSLQGAEKIASTIEARERKRRKYRQQLRDRMKNLENRLEAVRKTRRSCEKQLRSAESEVDRLRDRRAQLISRQREIVRDVDSLGERSEEQRRRRVRTEKELCEFKLRSENAGVRVAAWQGLKNSLEELRTSRQKQLEEINENLRDREKGVEKVKNEVSKLEQEQANLRERRGQQLELLEEEFDLSSVEELEALDTSEAAGLEDRRLEKKIREYKQQVRDLQPVNMLAEREAEELREELEEVKDQKQDLEKTCEKLENVIERMDRKARRQFKEAYAEIRGYFSDFVQELFGGGQGKLELTDEQVLEAGLEVEVQPPGEKLKTMSALSGGEKTLASIAFLFAMFEYSPSPFCFLDEVDAPFDHENVAQLISLLQRYSDETQFMIITHNKVTMQAADQLYGVTMEESGISTIVGLELPEAEGWREEAVG